MKAWLSYLIIFIVTAGIFVGTCFFRAIKWNGGYCCNCKQPYKTQIVLMKGADTIDYECLNCGVWGYIPLSVVN